VTSPVMVAPAVELNALRPRLQTKPQSAVLYGICAVLLFGPLAFGAVEPWAVFVVQSSAALLFLLWATLAVVNADLRIAWNPLFLPMLGFGVLTLLQLALRQTANRAATSSEFLLYCSYGLVCFLTVQCLCAAQQIKVLAAVLSAYGFAVATFALFQGISSAGKLCWLRSPRFGSWIYGPYVNHNHYAGLMELLVPIPLVIALSRRVQRRHKIIAAVAAAVMASTIFLSGSRGGMIAFTVEMAVLAVVLMKQRNRNRTSLALGGFLVIAVALPFWLGGGELLGRMVSISRETKAEISGGMRLAIDRDGLRMFSGKPVLGWGLGTFADVYPQFRSFYTNFLVDKAHNDYLQLLIEMGALGFGVMLWFLLAVYRGALKKVFARTPDIDSEVSLAVILGVTGILVHSVFDFNLQIPANAALFYVFCVIAAMEPRFSLQKHRLSRSPQNQQ